MIDPAHYYYLSAALFSIGLGVVLTRKNAIVILMGVELMLNAANINFLGFSQPNNLSGHFFALFVIVVAAAEAAVGLAIILNVYRHFKTVDLDKVNEIRD